MKLVLKERRLETDGVETFAFGAETPITWLAGQFLHYVLPHNNADDRGIERWFTISSPPFAKWPAITTKYFGAQSSSFKQALFRLKIGDAIEADGPEGHFVLDPQAKQHVFIAGGIGITPYYSMLAQLDHDQNMPNITLLYANSDQNIVFKNQLDQIAAQNPNLQINYFVGKHIADDDLKVLIGQAQTAFYLSGPRAMVAAYQNVLTGFNVPKESIRTDYFPGY